MKLYCKVVVFLITKIIVCVHAHSQTKTNLTFGGIFDIQTRYSQDSSANMIPAVCMAVCHVNENPEILKDYHINLDIKDVKCRSAHAIRALVDFINEPTKKTMIIGPGCSESAEPFAMGAGFFNLVQVSMATANPGLSCKRNFPTFVRTIPPEHKQNVGRIGIVRHFGWDAVGILREGRDTFQGLANDLVEKLEKAMINITTYETFTKDPAIQLDNLKSKDSRIIFGIFSEKAARLVVCKAYKKGMWGPKYVWILMSGSYRQRWWTVNDTNLCTPDEVHKGLGHFIGTKALMYGGDNEVTVAGKTVKELWTEYKGKIAGGKHGTLESPYAAFAYDAVWTAALALNASIAELKAQNYSKKIEDFHYNDVSMRKIFMSTIKKGSFMGMSGLVSFDKRYDRLSFLVIDQLQGEEMVQIGEYCMRTHILDKTNAKNVKWLGKKSPVCSTMHVRVPRFIETGQIYTMGSLCVMGIFMSLFFLFFNIKNRKIRYIKMSSPKLNNVILVGCIVIYFSGILLGLDGNVLSEQLQRQLCQLQAYSLAFGFTLAFGALFAKTWRVHIIFLKKTEKKIITDYQLFGMVGLMLVFDLMILLAWQLYDPISVVSKDLPVQVLADGDNVLHPFYSRCTSEYMTHWTSCLYAYKGFLLLFGCYLAFETRKVHIPALNDSRLIGMSVYNVVIPCALVIPVLHILDGQISAVYILSALLCIFCTTTTLCLIFVPKSTEVTRESYSQNLFEHVEDGGKSVIHIHRCNGNPSSEYTSNPSVGSKVHTISSMNSQSSVTKSSKAFSVSGESQGTVTKVQA